MNVRNVNGIGGYSCKCGSWLDHWRNFSEQPVPKYCPELGCLEKPEIGAHVQKDSTIDAGWYIIPLCKDHYGLNGKTLKIDDSMALVPANICVICNK